MLVPTEADVGWQTAGAWRSGWRGKIVEASYEFDH